jgi:DNA-binding FrmR family transcriptional regulator
MTMKIKEKLETIEGQMEGVRRLFDHAIFINK